MSIKRSDGILAVGVPQNAFLIIVSKTSRCVSNLTACIHLPAMNQGLHDVAV